MFSLTIILLRSFVPGRRLTKPFPQTVVDLSQPVTLESATRGRKFWNLVRRKKKTVRTEQRKHVGKVGATASSAYPELTGLPHPNSAIANCNGHVGQPQSHSSSANTPGENDKHYVIPPGQLASGSFLDSEERLRVAAVQDQNIIEDNQTCRETRDVGADEKQVAGVWRSIRVRYDCDPHGKQARVQQVMHDTGAGISLTFECKLNSLGLKFERIPMGTFQSVTGEKLEAIGMRKICFSYLNKLDKEHWVNLFVLEDPKHGMTPGFDMLFGRDFLFETRALAWNFDVIGVNALRRLLA